MTVGGVVLGGVVRGGGGMVIGGVVVGGVVVRGGGGTVIDGVVLGGVVVGSGVARWSAGLSRRGGCRRRWDGGGRGVGGWAAGVVLVVGGVGARHESEPESQTSGDEGRDHRDEDSQSFGHLTSFEVVGRCRVIAAAISGFGTLIRGRRPKSSFGDVRS